MPYVITCLDKPGALDLRIRTRERHLAYADTFVERLLLAGPMLDEEGAPIGSLFLLDAADAAEARRFADGDPYNEVGLFVEVTIRPFNVVRGRYAA